MIKFFGGPAAGVVLMLRRAPLFLRLVHNPRATKEPWDALDQLADEPKPHEVLHVYRLAKYDGRVHLKASRGARGFFMSATYLYLVDQPADEVLRDTAKWRAWALAEHAKIKGASE